MWLTPEDGFIFQKMAVYFEELRKVYHISWQNSLVSDSSINHLYIHEGFLYKLWQTTRRQYLALFKFFETLPDVMEIIEFQKMNPPLSCNTYHWSATNNHTISLVKWLLDNLGLVISNYIINTVNGHDQNSNLMVTIIFLISIYCHPLCIVTSLPLVHVGGTEYNYHAINVWSSITSRGYEPNFLSFYLRSPCSFQLVWPILCFNRFDLPLFLLIGLTNHLFK